MVKRRVVISSDQIEDEFNMEKLIPASSSQATSVDPIVRHENDVYRADPNLGLGVDRLHLSFNVPLEYLEITARQAPDGTLEEALRLFNHWRRPFNLASYELYPQMTFWSKRHQGDLVICKGYL